MLLDLSIACILKYSLAVFPFLETLFHRKKRIGIYVPEEIKADTIKFLQQNNKIATLDCDSEVFQLVRSEDRGKLTSDVALKKIVREKLIKICFKEYCHHFKKIVYFSSDINFIRENFKNSFYYLPDAVYINENKMPNYNKELIDLVAKEKKIKKKVHYFNCRTELLNLLNNLF